MKRAGLSILAALALAGCATDNAPKPVTTVTVNVPVPVSCVPKDFPAAPGRPLTAEDLKAAPDAAARYQLLGQFWNAWASRLGLDEVIIATCQRAAPSP